MASDSSTTSSADSYETDSGWSGGSSESYGTPLLLPSLWTRNLLRRRVVGVLAPSHVDVEVGNNNNDNRNIIRRKRQSHRVYCEALSTWAVVVSCSMFLYVIFWMMWWNPTSFYYSSDPYKTVRQRTKDRLYAEGGFTTRKSFFADFNIFRQENQKQQQRQHQETKDAEALPDGCIPMAWQLGNFPNCNAIHEISLPAIQRGTAEGRYVASGLWRDVWQVVTPTRTELSDETMVIKVLRNEHDVTDRNFDRHRRDALVMEQLTSHPYVVNIYGFCGNSIMTEALGTTLDDVLFGDARAQQQQQQQHPMTTNHTLRDDQLRWALDVARGVQALHQHGIVHADLQLEQFLFDHDTGRLKINDFNRCRFIAERIVDNHTSTTTRCPFRIPTAPGKQRSPEEYTYQELSEKIDIYSTANILYAIFTGQEPWGNFASAEAKRLIEKGYLQPMENALDPAFVQLTHQAYALDPTQRPNASELVAALEQLVL